MNVQMEHLNKTQIILLALLVSFVSSVATGIVTVTLMQQAPTGVTQTINRVVERTIEKIIPVKGATVTETKIIKEEDFIVSAVAANQNSVVKITINADPGAGVGGGEIGNGIILSEDGFIATDSGTATTIDQTYYAETADGQIIQLSRVSDKKGITLFKAIVKEKSPPLKLTQVKLSDSDLVQVGQSMISLGDAVATGIVSGLVYEKADGDPATASKILSQIRTSTSQRDSLGSAVINLDGNVIGMVAARSGIRVAVPSNVIKDALAEARKI
ncbi:MAG: serine protease [Candidatus Paceibacterota bacterium]|jgi:S1-C subfamily serine protease